MDFHSIEDKKQCQIFPKNSPTSPSTLTWAPKLTPLKIVPSSKTKLHTCWLVLLPMLDRGRCYFITHWYWYNWLIWYTTHRTLHYKRDNNIMRKPAQFSATTCSVNGNVVQQYSTRHERHASRLIDRRSELTSVWTGTLFLNSSVADPGETFFPLQMLIFNNFRDIIFTIIRFKLKPLLIW